MQCQIGPRAREDAGVTAARQDARSDHRHTVSTERPCAACAPALSQMVVGMARSAVANASIARLRLPGVVAAASPTWRQTPREGEHASVRAHEHTPSSMRARFRIAPQFQGCFTPPRSLSPERGLHCQSLHSNGSTA